MQGKSTRIYKMYQELLREEIKSNMLIVTYQYEIMVVKSHGETN